MEKINTQNILTSTLYDVSNMTEDEYQEWLCAKENTKRIEPDAKYGVDCPVCGNKGVLLSWDRENQVRTARTCICEKSRASLRRLEKSGVCADWRNKTIDRFAASNEWQQVLKSKVSAYITDTRRGWLFVSGQSGCGKTHLCTAAFVSLVQAGLSGHYKRWSDLMQEMDAAYYTREEYEKLTKPLLTCRVLYLDDLFKSQNNASVSNRAFDHTLRILDARYQNPELLTILSTEWTLDRLIAFDEALGGRIAERCGKYIVQVAAVDGRNYRLQ